MTITIERVLVFGDSLSDRGMMQKSILSPFSGLIGNSPYGRFTDGYVWLDFFINQLKTTVMPTIEAKAVPKAQKKKGWRLVNNEEYVGLPSLPVFARTYCKGGMTAFDYSEKIRLKDPLLNLEAQVLSTLSSMLKEALKDDQFSGMSIAEKQATLVIEWSGANDLITINHEPTIEAAELAVKSRINHVEQMIANGYKNFVLFNLPDLSLTPRFQNGEERLKNQAHHTVNHFNQELINQVTILEERFDCHIQVFDANELFTDAFNHPEKYGFHADKKNSPFLSSTAAKDNDPTTTAEGYMFWDEVHPTEAVHKILADALYRNLFEHQYQFHFSPQPLVKQFTQDYGMKWEDESSATCGYFRKSRMNHLDPELTLENILEHGIFNKGYRTRRSMVDIGWINKKNELISEDPSVSKAWHAMHSSRRKIPDAVPTQDTQEITDPNSIGLQLGKL